MYVCVCLYSENIRDVLIDAMISTTTANDDNTAHEHRLKVKLTLTILLYIMLITR